MKRLLLLSLLSLLSFSAMLLPVSMEGANASALPSVCIDPGHGGSDPGTSNRGILEKDLNLDVANRLTALLRAGGYTVYQTRTLDQTLSNNDRYTFCNAQQTTILVSVHHNGSSNPAVDYSMALYMKKPDVSLARALVDAVAGELHLPNNGISRFSSGVLLKSTMPAAISEGFFLTSSSEYALLTDPNSTRGQDEAQALYNGIVAYFARR
ncbi:MAG: N-acetylmuramoyl-L-alanine amidase [Chloroflexota bacterium]|nr:N-acetylmuramoyl-L-alanine amidase [Chloroflexota bacterium]